MSMEDATISDNSSENTYWASVEKQLQTYRENIMGERKFIGETLFSVGDLDIVVGISIARGFLPTVRLEPKRSSTETNGTNPKVICLLQHDWDIFIKLLNTYYEMDFPNSTAEVTDGILTAEVTDGILNIDHNYFPFANLHLQSNDNDYCATITLNMQNVCEILVKSCLISYKLNILSNLHFGEYVHFFALSNQLSESSLHSLKEHCLLYLTEINYYMLEYLDTLLIQ